MKKRVLSFLLACFMVVSTFIISRPLVDVHAVEYVEGENMWTVPEDFVTNATLDGNKWPVVGNYSLRAYAYTSGTANTNFDSVLTSKDVAGSWYYNPTNQSMSAFITSNGSKVGMTVNPYNATAAIVFSAPSTGLYEFAEVVRQTSFVNAAGDADTTVEWTVVKLGTGVIEKFVGNTSNLTKTLGGAVALKKGEELLFVARKLNSSSSFFSNSAAGNYASGDYTKGYFNAFIDSLVVKKTAELTDDDFADIYELPMNWLRDLNKDENGWDLAEKGQWKLTSFADPANVSTIRNNPSSTKLVSGADYKLSPYSYIESYNHRMIYASYDTGFTGWYVNYRWRWQTVAFAKGDNQSFIIVTPRNAENANNPTVVFTAPEDGTYSYSELVSGGLFDKGVSVTATVRVNGRVINTFIPTESIPTATVSGSAVLKKGDLLMFTFEQTSAVSLDDYEQAIRLGATTVKRIGDAPTNYKGEADITPVFEVGSLTDKLGNVTLMGYKTDAAGVGADKLYPITEIITETTNGTWIAIDPEGKHGTNYSWGGSDRGYNLLWAVNKETGLITNVGGAQLTNNTGSAIVFTAPRAGTYKFHAEMNSWYPKTNSIFNDYVIMKGNGTELIRKNDVGLANQTIITVEATAFLEKGEQVLIIKHLHDSSKKNTSNNGVASVQITELTHYCDASTLSDYTVGQPPFCAPNIDGYYACYCGAYYKDADAAEEIANDGHDWNDGYCADCETICQHDGANVADCQNASVCPICAKELAPIDSTNHVKINGVYVNTGKGTHRYNHICCDYADIAEEKCVYGTDDICDKCGYDNTILGNATINKNNAFNNAFNGGTNNVTVVGPTDGLSDYAAKIIGTEIDGVTYTMFNIHHDNDGNVILRHHFLIEESGVKIYVNGTEQALTAEGNNYYFFDVTPVLGKYDVADEIKVVLGDATVAYTASLYSYIKVALADTENTLSLAQIDLLKALYDLNELAKPEEQTLVAMANQNAGAGESGRTGAWIDVYDISSGNMNTPVWTYDTPLTSISGFKFRNVAPYGNVVLVCVGTQAEMVAMDTKEVVWSTNESSNNSHSIDILPNGVIVSGGTSDNTLTFFNSADGKDAKCLLEFSFPDAHGVLWDPTYEVVWIVGVDKLTAYKVTLEDDGSITAVKDENLSVVTPETGLHDLQPYFGRDNCLLISTANHVYIYDIANKTFEAIIEESHVKGVGVLPNGDIIYMYWDGLTVGSEAWNTTYIKRMDADGNVVQIDSNQGRFYKCRVLNFNYK